MWLITKLWNDLRRQLRQLFGLSKSETNGIFLLLVLLWLLLTFPAVMRWYRSKYKPMLQDDIDLLDSTVAELESARLSHLETPSFSPVPSNPAPSSSVKKAKKHNIHLDINLAQEHVLQKLPGIGPVLAKRIIKYRNRLGGFVKKEQYKEIYGLDTLGLNSMLCCTAIMPNYRPLQINVNEADFKAMLKHPYLSYDQVKNIVRLRKAKHKLDHVAQLLTEGTIDSVTFDKIKPYLITTMEKDDKR